MRMQKLSQYQVAYDTIWEQIVRMEKALNALSVGQVDMLDTDQLKQNNLMDGIWWIPL